jgi:hypothetical protein
MRRIGVLMSMVESDPIGLEYITAFAYDFSYLYLLNATRVLSAGARRRRPRAKATAFARYPAGQLADLGWE